MAWFLCLVLNQCVSMVGSYVDVLLRQSNGCSLNLLSSEPALLDLNDEGTMILQNDTNYTPVNTV